MNTITVQQLMSKIVKHAINCEENRFTPAYIVSDMIDYTEQKLTNYFVVNKIDGLDLDDSMYVLDDTIATLYDMGKEGYPGYMPQAA
jgi:hypothetical protein